MKFIESFLDIIGQDVFGGDGAAAAHRNMETEFFLDLCRRDIRITIQSGTQLKKASSTISPHRDHRHTPTPIFWKFRLSAVRETPSCSDT